MKDQILNNFRAVLTGAKVVGVRRMTPIEVEEQGWYGEGPIVIMLQIAGGKKYPLLEVYAMQDEEGNGPGALAVDEVAQ